MNKNLKIGLLLIPLIVLAVIIFNTNKGETIEEKMISREYTVNKGAITVGIESSGAINLSGEKTNYDMPLKIGTLKVKNGTEVTKGQVLAQLDGQYLMDDLKANQKQIDNLEFKYQQTSSQKAIYIDENQLNSDLKETELTTTYQQNLDSKRQILSNLEKQLQEFSNDLSNTNQQLDSIMQQVNDLQSSITTLQAKLDLNATSIIALNNQLTDLENEEIENTALITNIKQQISDLQLENKTIQTSIDEINNMTTMQQFKQLNQTSQTLNAQLNDANLQKQRLDQEIENINADYQKALDKLVDSNKISDQKIKNQLDDYNMELTNIKSELNLLADMKDKLLALVNDPYIYASTEGVITSLRYKDGEVLEKGQSLCEIGSLNKATITIPVAASDINLIEVNQKVELFVEAYAEKKFSGKVVERLLYANENGDYPITIEIDDSDVLLLPGMKTYANIILKQKKDILTLSNRAIFIEDGKQFVNLKKADGTIVPQPIKTGFSDGRVTEIVEGLNENDIVMIRG